MLDIAEELARWAGQGRDFAVATVVAVGGSAPRQPGAALAVDRDGTAIGSVSGGCVEGAVYELCQEALDDGLTRIERFGYSDEDAFAVGLTCGGVIDILVTPVRVDDPARPVFTAALAAAVRGRRRRSPGSPTGPPNSSAVPCWCAPTAVTRAGSADTPSSTVPPWPKPAPCSTRGAPAPSPSAPTARAAGSPSRCSWSPASRRPG